jgi:hypothetical protein
MWDFTRILKYVVLLVLDEQDERMIILFGLFGKMGGEVSC